MRRPGRHDETLASYELNLARDRLAAALADVEAKESALADVKACLASDRSFALHILAADARRAGVLVRYVRGFGVVTSKLIGGCPMVVVPTPKEPAPLVARDPGPRELNYRKEQFEAFPSADRHYFYYRATPCKPGCGDRFGAGPQDTRTWKPFIAEGSSHLDFCTKECMEEYEWAVRGGAET